MSDLSHPPALYVDLDTMASMVPGGASVVAGGLPLWRKPVALIRALARSGVSDLRYSAFLASYDAQLLAEGGSLAQLEYGYLGLDVFGSIRSLRRASGFSRRPRTEIEYWSAIRASALGVETGPDAFGNDTLAEHFDICLLHAGVADAEGNIYADPLDVMEEDDVLLAHAAHRVLVTVERRVERVPSDATLLLRTNEVHAVCIAPRGAAPLGMAGHYAPTLGEPNAPGEVAHR